jgi:hypothetical protein
MEKQKEYVYRRAEIAARLFLEELGAEVWTTVEDGNKGPFDAIASFVTQDQKARITAIEVKATEQPVGQEFHFEGRPGSVRALQHSNVPVLFLVVDVKRNQLFYGWAKDVRCDSSPPKGRQTVRCTLPVVPAEQRKAELMKTILSQPEFSEPAGVG